MFVRSRSALTVVVQVFSSGSNSGRAVATLYKVPRPLVQSAQGSGVCNGVGKAGCINIPDGGVGIPADSALCGLCEGGVIPPYVSHGVSAAGMSMNSVPDCAGGSASVSSSPMSCTMFSTC